LSLLLPPTINYTGPKDQYDMYVRRGMSMLEIARWYHSQDINYRVFEQKFHDGAEIRIQTFDGIIHQDIVNIKAPGGKKVSEEERVINNLVFVIFFAPLGNIWALDWKWDDLQLFSDVEYPGRIFRDQKLYTDPTHIGYLPTDDRFKITEYNYELEELVRIGLYSEKSTGRYNIGIVDDFEGLEPVNPGGAWTPDVGPTTPGWAWYYSGKGLSWWYLGPWGTHGWDEPCSPASYTMFMSDGDDTTYKLIIYLDGLYSNVVTVIEEGTTSRRWSKSESASRTAQPQYTPGIFGSNFAYPESYSEADGWECSGLELVYNSGDIVSGYSDLGYSDGYTWGVIFGRAEHSWSQGGTISGYATDNMGQTYSEVTTSYGEWPEPRHDIHYYLKVSDTKDGSFEFDLGDVITESSGEHLNSWNAQRFTSQLLIYNHGGHPLYVFSTYNWDTGAVTYGYVYQGKFKRSVEFPSIGAPSTWDAGKHDFFGSSSQGLYGCGIIRAAIEITKERKEYDF
jgi:hypothetical protein